MPMNQLPMYKDCHYITQTDKCKTIHDSCLLFRAQQITEDELEKVVKTIKIFFACI